MGTRKYPPLTPREIEAILIARGFSLHKMAGDHRFYIHNVKGKKKIAQIDMGNPLYEGNLIKSILKETGLSRDEFYRSTKSTAKKIGLNCVPKDELEKWALA